jgi:hypothetical protein
MDRDEKLSKIVIECYQALFAAAEPPLDFKKDVLVKAEKGTKMPEQWFMEHYLDDKIQTEIITKICKKHKLKERDASTVSINVCLGCAPSGVRRKKTFKSMDELKKHYFPQMHYTRICPDCKDEHTCMRNPYEQYPIR